MLASPNAREIRALVLPYKAIKQSQQPLDLDPQLERNVQSTATDASLPHSETHATE